MSIYRHFLSKKQQLTDITALYSSRQHISQKYKCTIFHRQLFHESLALIIRCVYNPYVIRFHNLNPIFLSTLYFMSLRFVLEKNTNRYS